MNLVCLFCSARFRAAVDEPLREAVRLACPACQKELVLRPGGKGSQPGAAVPHRTAVIADEPRPFRDFLEGELKRLGFETRAFDRGDAALDEVLSSRADLVIINVAQKKGRMGVELAEEIRKNPDLSATRVILTGPLFRANRFRNDPATLYGADDYFEDQIPRRSLEKRVRAMFDGAKSSPSPSPDLDAQRLARLILSEIISSNKDRVDQALRNGTFFDALKKEIEEGRTYYNSHVPHHIRQYNEYFNEALQEFVKLKSEE